MSRDNRRGLLKDNDFYIEYFFLLAVVIKAQRVEKRDFFLSKKAVDIWSSPSGIMC